MPLCDPCAAPRLCLCLHLRRQTPTAPPLCKHPHINSLEGTDRWCLAAAPDVGPPSPFANPFVPSGALPGCSDDEWVLVLLTQAEGGCPPSILADLASTYCPEEVGGVYITTGKASGVRGDRSCDPPEVARWGPPVTPPPWGLAITVPLAAMCPLLFRPVCPQAARLDGNFVPSEFSPHFRSAFNV